MTKTHVTEQKPDHDDCNIERCTANTEFALTPNEISQHPTMSSDATTVLIYLLSCKSDWVVKPKCVWRAKNISRNHVYKAFDELIGLGYMKREEIRNGNLKGKTKYRVAYFKKYLRRPGSRDTEIRDVLISNIPKKDDPDPEGKKNNNTTPIPIPLRDSRPRGDGPDPESVVRNSASPLFPEPESSEALEEKDRRWIAEGVQHVALPSEVHGLLVTAAKSGADMAKMQTLFEEQSARGFKSNAFAWLLTAFRSRYDTRYHPPQRNAPSGGLNAILSRWLHVYKLHLRANRWKYPRYTEILENFDRNAQQAIVQMLPDPTKDETPRAFNLKNTKEALQAIDIFTKLDGG